MIQNGYHKFFAPDFIAIFQRFFARIEKIVHAISLQAGIGFKYKSSLRFRY